MILAGDIGGTNSRLAFFELDGKRLKPAAIEVFPSRNFKNLAEIIERFIELHPGPVDDCCLGVAGPVRDGVCEASNLPWIVDAGQLARRLGLGKIELINDLEANAHGISELTPGDFVVLNEGARDRSGNEALIAAGTGLGEAGLHWEGDYYQPFPSEGGHVDFAPRTPLEIALLSCLLKQFEHVSYERVLSGPGLHNIYKFLRDSGYGVEPEWLSERMRGADAPGVISRAALAGECELCIQALDVFVSIYGAETGNLTLKVMATGGVYVGGGIAPRIVAKLKEPLFMKAFAAKGRMQELLEAVPVRVIVNERTALFGAARVAHLGVRSG
jgi:glucokinase